MAGTELQCTESAHRVVLEGRNKLSVCGVRDVESFDENMVVLITNKGVLIVRGLNLHLQMLSLEGGQVAVDGEIESLVYEEDKVKGGLFSRLLG
jgi:sporulation protein YabP